MRLTIVEHCGKFYVRRWSWKTVSYRYLDNMLMKKSNGDSQWWYWWERDNAELCSLASARRLIDSYAKLKQQRKIKPKKVESFEI